METVAENIYRITTPYKDIYTTVTVIRTLNGVVVFDTASYREDVEKAILPALDNLGVREEELKYIVLSHCHGDHAGGLEWMTEAFPKACILSRNFALQEKYGMRVRCPEDGERILDSLEIITVPVHSEDSLCLLDTVTGTLVSGDSLQLYGIYGSGAWGANVGMPAEYLEAIEKLKRIPVQRVLASHDYHPFGWLAEGNEAVEKYLDACRSALYKILDAVNGHPEIEAEALAEAYNATSGLPTVSARVFKALRAAAQTGKI